MPPITLQEFYGYALFFVLAITLYIAVVIAMSKNKMTVLTAPLRWMCYPFLYLIAVIHSFWERYWGKEYEPYDREKDPEYIRMMREVGNANSLTGMSHSLRSIYSELYNVSLSLNQENTSREIYQAFKESRLDDLIAHKANRNIDSLKVEVACNISTLACFWENGSIERTTYFLLTALDYQTQTAKELTETDPK